MAQEHFLSAQGVEFALVVVLVLLKVMNVVEMTVVRRLRQREVTARLA
jgi:hypothetical protein